MAKVKIECHENQLKWIFCLLSHEMNAIQHWNTKVQHESQYYFDNNTHIRIIIIILHNLSFTLCVIAIVSI